MKLKISLIVILLLLTAIPLISSDETYEPFDPTDWLYYHGDHGGLMQGGYTVNWTISAIRLTPIELADYDGYQIITVGFMHNTTHSDYHNGDVRIYAKGNSTSPGSLITNESFNVSGYGWKNITLSNPVVIDNTEEYWVGVNITLIHPPDISWFMERDVGPAVDGKGDWLLYEGLGGGEWIELQDIDPPYTDFNHMIRAGIASPIFKLRDTQDDGSGGEYDWYWSVWCNESWNNESYIYATCMEDGIRAYTFDGKDFTLLATQDDGNQYKGVWSDGTYIYTACDSDGIRAYSFNGTDFTLLDTQYDIGSYWSVWGDGTYIYVGAYGDGFHIYSFNGTDFTLLASRDDGTHADALVYHVYSDGTYVYVPYYVEGVRAYSFNGTNLTLLDTQDDGGNYWNVWGDGTYIYTACYEDGIRAYTFNGTNFTLIDTQDDGGRYLRLWYDGNYLYVANSIGGVKAYTFNGTDFKLIDSRDDGSGVEDYYIHVYGDDTYIYTACYDDGIRAYEFEEPFPPNQPTNEFPENNSIDIDPETYMNVTVTNPDGDNIDVSFYWSNNSHIATLNNVINNSVASIYIPDYESIEYSTNYTWYVTVNNSYFNITGPLWSFQTMEAPNPPNQPTNEIPANNSDYVVPETYMNVTVTDPDEDNMTVSFYWGNDSHIATLNNVINNSVASIYLPDYQLIEHNTDYSWYVTVDDGTDNITSPIWNFNTSMAWDLNSDRIINYLDISILVSNYGESGDPGWIPADINNDGIVNYLDASILVSHYGESY